MQKYILLLTLIGLSSCDWLKNVRNEVRKFPDGFLFGSASSAYQIEGAWNKDGKGVSIWDHETHRVPSFIKDQSTGDIAANSYHLYKRDVEMTRELGLDFYRFSLSWTRILPTGFSHEVNQAGVDYYNNLINELLKYNIQPMVTLYHWDLPQRLQDLGGWTNPHIVEWFGDFAKIAFKLFGDRVKFWITINEPALVCFFGYDMGILAPGINIHGVGGYMCTKYILLAHARAYHIYDQEFRSFQGGSIFITLVSQWFEQESERDVEAAEYTRQFTIDIFAHPIFSEIGGWPAMVEERIASKSAEQGFRRSRLPDLTQEEIDQLRGTSDFIGINHYSSFLVNTNASIVANYPKPSFHDDVGIYSYQLDEWALNEADIIMSVPWGFYKLLMYLTKRYRNAPIFVTENGLGTRATKLEDDNRVTYYKRYLDALLDAIDDGADVRGYTAWCLMDNFEWIHGYTGKYGLYHVDYEDPERPRTPRKSAFLYKEIVRTRALDMNYEPEITDMIIENNDTDSDPSSAKKITGGWFNFLRRRPV